MTGQGWRRKLGLDSGWKGFARLSSLLVSLVGLGFLLVLPLDWMQQSFLSVVLIAVAVWVNRSFRNEFATLGLAVLSVFCSARYILYRLLTTAGIGVESGPKPTALDMAFMLVLLAAELYAFIILVLGYIQTIRPLNRKPVPLPEDPEQWPTVDIFIPSYNEPLAVVRYTVWAAMSMDWPAHRYKVHILDDGRREEFREFAAAAGCGYITRTNNAHAKAGNINHALTVTDAEYVAIFDCDHVPTRSFLQMVMGWFVRDPKLAMLQTPHHFYSPDPFERNLRQFRKIPNEGELFYGLVQDGNDLWNATFFCGSCAVLRRTALQEIGGIAVETVTEDAHTSLRMQIRGWSTAYLNIPQAAGLATESLSSHVGQRIRWARGMIQIMRLDNPLTRPRLKLFQRLCYFNAMVHFLYALPRLIFLTSPLVYLLFGHLNIRGYSLAITAYALPHIFLSNIINSRIQGEHRYSFWNEIYEAVLAPYILFPTLLALVNPRLGKFNVTAKGGLVPESYFDRKIARPYLILLALNVAGILFSIPRFIWWDASHPGTVAMNVIWTLYNVMMLGVVNAVAYETKQNRGQVRVSLKLPATLHFQDGSTLEAQTIDLSNSGVALRTFGEAKSKDGEQIFVSFSLRTSNYLLPAKVIGNRSSRLRLEFAKLSLEQEEALTRVLYSRADSWLGWGEERERDRPFRSLLQIMRLSIKGLGLTAKAMMPRKKAVASTQEKGSIAEKAASAAVLVIAILLLNLGIALPARAGSVPDAASVPFAESFDFGALGHKQAITLRGEKGQDALRFGIASSRVANSAKLHLRYVLSRRLLEKQSRLKLSLNQVDLPPLPLTRSTDQQSAEITIDIPAEILLSDNVLQFELQGICASGVCDPELTSTQIDSSSQLEISGQSFVLPNDLALLPHPFFDQFTQTPVIVPFVISNKENKTLEAAGVLASWFGSLADQRGARFPVSFHDIPQGNVILMASSPSEIPAALSFGPLAGPAVSIRENPSDRAGKLLIVAGRNGDELLEAARALATGKITTKGPIAGVENSALPEIRGPNDAPRWLNSSVKGSLLGSMAENDLKVIGSGSLNLYFRLDPDLYFGHRASIPLELNYHYQELASTPRSTADIELNGTHVAQLALPGGAGVQHAVIELPITALQPYSNVLSLRFDIHSFNDSEKPIVQILQNTELELQDVAHFLSMPQLERFADAGYPFTRFADLSRTAVVLSPDASAQDIEMLLNLVGYMGAQTGLAAIRLTVCKPAEVSAVQQNDLIVLGRYRDESLLAPFAEKLPLRISNGMLRVNRQDTFMTQIRRLQWNPPGRTRHYLEDLLDAGKPSAAILGFESPFQSGRSVVAILTEDRDTAELVAAQLSTAARNGDIYGTVSVLQNGRFESLYLSKDEYHLGTLPWDRAIIRWLGERVWLLPALTLTFSFLPVFWLLPWIERQVQLRLQGGA